MREERLPFGRTRVSPAEYEASINAGNAVTVLANASILDPRDKVSAFIYHVPDLLNWLEQNGRNYPWRSTTNPWRIYASEILLQRTRADAVADIYDSFFQEFPDPSTVVDADDETIYSQIQSLGFGNQRARSIRDAATLCVDHHNGCVPENLDELQRPWRVGPYSARACLMFAFGDPFALVDANIARIIGRVFDYELPNQPHKSEAVYSLMAALTPDEPSLARAFNLALLDLGALICTEVQPQSEVCPLNTCCAYAQRENIEE